MKNMKKLLIVLIASILFMPGVLAGSKYTVKFNKNGGTGTTSKVVCTVNKKCTLTSNSFKKTGYIFDGWNTKKDGSGKSYKDKSKVKNLVKKGTVTLYAQWKPIAYTIKFNGNGNNSGKTASLLCTYGSKCKLTKNNFVRDGYNFIGWNTKKDGSGISYNDKQKVKNLTNKNNKTIKLYAQWENVAQYIANNVDVKLTGFKNGASNNSYATIYISNDTDDVINISTYARANNYNLNYLQGTTEDGYACNLKSGYYVNITYYRATLWKYAWDDKYYDMYLDNESQGFLPIIYKGKYYHIIFDKNGTISVE